MYIYRYVHVLNRPGPCLCRQATYFFGVRACESAYARIFARMFACKHAFMYAAYGMYAACVLAHKERGEMHACMSMHIGMKNRVPKPGASCSVTCGFLFRSMLFSIFTCNMPAAVMCVYTHPPTHASQTTCEPRCLPWTASKEAPTRRNRRANSTVCASVCSSRILTVTATFTEAAMALTMLSTSSQSRVDPVGICAIHTCTRTHKHTHTHTHTFTQSHLLTHIHTHTTTNTHTHAHTIQ